MRTIRSARIKARIQEWRDDLHEQAWVGQAFNFNGVNGTVVVPDSSGLRLTSELTIEAWINTRTTNGDQIIVSKASSPGGGIIGYQFDLHNNEISGNFSGIPSQTWPQYTVETPVPIVLNTWNHVAWTYNQSSMIVYFNGEPVATNVIGFQGIGTTSVPLTIGSTGNSVYFNGLMDEVSVYNTALPTAQILAIYNAGSAGKCADVPPAITSEPLSGTVFASNTVSFSVTTSGSPPLSYQWFENTTNIPATGNATATNATLVLTNVQVGQSGNIYSVLVTNLEGSTNSSNAVLTVLASGSCLPPAPGLVSWWQGEGNASDSSGTNNGNLVGGVTFAPGEVGQAFSFNGTSVVQVPDAPNLNYTNNSPMSVELWVYRTGPQSQMHIIGKRNSGCGTNEYQMAWDANNGGLSFGGWYGGAFSGVVLPVNVWMHLAGTYDGTNFLFYTNGVLAGAGTGSLGPVNTAPLTIGDSGDCPGFVGLIDEASLYNRALSAAEIRAIYLAGSAGKCTDFPPVLTSQPQSETTFASNTVNFSVTTSGSPPLSYQWFENTTNIPAAVNATATKATLVLTNVQVGQSGNIYSVMVTNLEGSTNSSNVVLTVLAPGSCLPPAPGLVSWWPGEDTAIDIAGTNNGALQGGVSFTNGIVGRAFDFDGASGTVVVPDSSSLRLTNELTIEAWINPRTTNGDQIIVSKAGNLGPGFTGYEFGFHNNELTGAFNSAAGQPWPLYYAQTPIPIALGTWNHVAWTYNQAALIVYFNGQPVATNTVGAQRIGTTSVPLQISGSGNIVFFNGLIDEVSVYNTALSAAQILAIYDAGSTGKCKEPVIAGQPQNQDGYYGSSVFLSVNATGSGTLSYQWLLNDVAITNATNATLSLGNLQPANAGEYSVIISNLYGVTTSAPALVTVNPPGISLALYPGLTISGAPGFTYGIQYSTNLSNTNDWLGLANVTLSGTNELYFDLQPATAPQRSYRVVPGPISIP